MINADEREIVYVQDYYPYGEILRSYTTGGNVNDKYKYTEKERDTESGWDYFGVRYYDSDLARWLQVDPLADKLVLSFVEGYPGWSPYNYTLNNPLKFIDPDGKKIKHHKDNSKSFRELFKKTIEYLNKKGISSVVNELEKRNEVIILKEGKWKFDTYYDHKTKTLYYNPYYALEIPNGEKQTPALGFLHEAGHALQDVKSPEEYIKDLRTENEKYGNEEERRVIVDIETPAASKAGEGTRYSHGGTTYRTSGPTSTEKIKDPIYDEE